MKPSKQFKTLVLLETKALRDFSVIDILSLQTIQN